jgi:hypothetical protein
MGINFSQNPDIDINELLGTFSDMFEYYGYNITYTISIAD